MDQNGRRTVLLNFQSHDVIETYWVVLDGRVSKLTLRAIDI